VDGDNLWETRLRIEDTQLGGVATVLIPNLYVARSATWVSYAIDPRFTRAGHASARFAGRVIRPTSLTTNLRGARCSASGRSNHGTRSGAPLEDLGFIYLACDPDQPKRHRRDGPAKAETSPSSASCSVTTPSGVIRPSRQSTPRPWAQGQEFGVALQLGHAERTRPFDPTLQSDTTGSDHTPRPTCADCAGSTAITAHPARIPTSSQEAVRTRPWNLKPCRIRNFAGNDDGLLAVD
jgi:hypothetical protein